MAKVLSTWREDVGVPVTESPQREICPGASRRAAAFGSWPPNRTLYRESHGNGDAQRKPFNKTRIRKLTSASGTLDRPNRAKPSIPSGDLEAKRRRQIERRAPDHAKRRS